MVSTNHVSSNQPQGAKVDSISPRAIKINEDQHAVEKCSKGGVPYPTPEIYEAAKKKKTRAFRLPSTGVNNFCKQLDLLVH